MAARTGVPIPGPDLIRLCRRLASALHSDEAILSVLDSLAGRGSHDAEQDDRLTEALPVIADYLLDVAQQPSAQRPKREAHNE